MRLLEVSRGEQTMKFAEYIERYAIGGTTKKQQAAAEKLGTHLIQLGFEVKDSGPDLEFISGPVAVFYPRANHRGYQGNRQDVATVMIQKVDSNDSRTNERRVSMMGAINIPWIELVKSFFKQNTAEAALQDARRITWSILDAIE